MFDTDWQGIAPGPALAKALAVVDIEHLDAGAALSFLQASRRQQAWTEALSLEAAARFAEWRDEVPDVGTPGAELIVQVGGAGTPKCASFAADELGPELHTSRESAWRLMADALDLKYRLPRVLACLRAGGTDAYRARLVASCSRTCSPEAAAEVQTAVLGRLDRLTRAQVVRVVDETLAVHQPELLEAATKAARQDRFVVLEPSRDGHIGVWAKLAAGPAIRLDARIDQLADALAARQPELLETKAQLRARALGLLADPDVALQLLQPRGQTPGSTRAGSTTLYVHLSPDGVTTLEKYGVLGLPAVRELLADTEVSVKPVIDLAHMQPSTGYQPSDTLREGVILANPTCAFPYCNRDARKAQLDHNIPYPRGDTAAENLGPFCPHHHNVKTHGNWAVKQPFKGIFVWRSPTGRIHIVDHRHTHSLAA